MFPRSSWLVVVPALALQGCLYGTVNLPLSYRAPTFQDVASPDAMRVGAREVTGEACNHEVLGLVAWGDGGYAAAVENAKATSGAALLVDVKADLQVTFILLGVYARTCTRVTGRVMTPPSGETPTSPPVAPKPLSEPGSGSSDSGAEATSPSPVKPLWEDCPQRAQESLRDRALRCHALQKAAAPAP